MKKNVIYSVILTGGLIFAVALVYTQDPTPKKPVTEQQQVQYTCPMHPEVLQDEPGKCPVCGMQLVEKKGVQKEKTCQMKDSTKMHHEHIMHDTTGGMMKHHMMKDTTLMKHDHDME